MNFKTIDTLIKDIYSTIEGNGVWTEDIKKFYSEASLDLIETRLADPTERQLSLSPSTMGEPCKRKLWYSFNTEYKKKTPAGLLGTFLYGDIVELFVLALVKAAGHTVEGYQEELKIGPLKGTSDCIIDGVLVDIKSASGFGFKKFRENSLKEEDPYGYISQLSSYLYGYRNDPRVTNKNAAAFLVVNKERFEVVLDFYDLTNEVKNKEKEIKETQEIINHNKPPDRPKWKFLDKDKEPYYAEDEVDGLNRKLGKYCSWCPFKFTCWDNNLRTFKYSTGPRYYTEIEKEPRVPEVT